MRFDKIVQAYRSGTLLWKVNREMRGKLKKHRKFFFVKNKNAQRYIEECKTYYRLKKEFSDTIRKGVEDSESSQYPDVIWLCWLQGYNNAPPLIKACMNSIKDAFPEKKIVLLSEENLREYVEIPNRVQELYKSGKMSPAHFSDFVRISLICKYGGIWMDSTVLCTAPDFVNSLAKYPLFVFKQMDLIRRDEEPIVASNWFISASSNEKILMLTKKLLLEYWHKYDYAIDYYIFHIFFKLATERYCDLWSAVPFYNNASPHTLQFELSNSFDELRWRQIVGTASIHKLNRYDSFNINGTFYRWIIDKYGNRSIENN